MRFVNIYLRSDAIIVTNTRFYLNDAFTKIYNLLDVWQGEGSGWSIDTIQDIHINISDYDSLAGSSYLKLPTELQYSMRRLINIHNTQCFKWCHVRLLNPTNKKPQRIKKVDKEIANQLDYSNFEFSMQEKQYTLFEKRFNSN